jgi:hypothetical protein
MVKENCTSENLTSKNELAIINTAVITAVYAIRLDIVLLIKSGEKVTLSINFLFSKEKLQYK